MNKVDNSLYEYRLKILSKIKEYEKEGKFNENVEDDPPAVKLMPNDVDYLNKKFKNKVNTFIANTIAINYIRRLIKKKQLIIKEVRGLKNLTELDEGCILTCNHFNPYDNFTLHEILYDYIIKSKRRFYKVIREGNYSFKGLFGYFFRHCETLPLSSRVDTMKDFTHAMGELLNRKSIILIYPEQSMWWNYRKPRVLKPGAFKYAVKFGVPVVPCFITMNDSNIIGKDGFNIQEYVVHFLEPIYPNKELSSKEQVKELCEANYRAWVKVYESFYQEKLDYEEEN